MQSKCQPVNVIGESKTEIASDSAMIKSSSATYPAIAIGNHQHSSDTLNSNAHHSLNNNQRRAGVKMNAQLVFNAQNSPLSLFLPQEVVESILSSPAINSPVFVSLSVASTASLSFLLLFFPWNLGIAVNFNDKTSLRGAKIIMEKDNQVYAQRIVNALGAYRGFKLPVGNYLLRVEHGNYRFPLTSVHQQLKLDSRYYPRVFISKSLFSPTIAPVLNLYDTAASVNKTLPWSYYLLSLLRFLSLLHPLSIALLILFALITGGFWYYLILLINIIGVMRQIMIKA